MTDKEAISVLECAEFGKTTWDKPMLTEEEERLDEARDIAVSALQEREERSNPTKAWRMYSYDEWICPYCGYDKYCDTLDGGVLPPFCEECGRPLKEG